MSVWQCRLCTYKYDEAKEMGKFEDLSPDWVCPICGSAHATFGLAKAGHTPLLTEPPAPPATYNCGLCTYSYEETNEEALFDDLPGNWICPICGSGKDSFSKKKIIGASSIDIADTSKAVTMDDTYLSEWHREADDFEKHMSDIHYISQTGQSVIESMRTRVETFSWDNILIKGAQLSKEPLNRTQPVNMQTVIGPNAAVPLVINGPMIVTHMSFGALSREAKSALTMGSAQAKTAMCSGEGGILPENLNSAYKYIFEYVPNKYSVTDEHFKQVDAVEIKIGQSAKPGMGGLLPGAKVTPEIAAIRGMREGQTIVSPSHFPDIRSPDELKKTVDMLREKTQGKPIGIKIAAGHIKKDIEIALYAGADYITIDGRAGGTAAAPKVVKDAASVPTIFALAQARKALDDNNAKNVTLVITGGFRVSSDVAKAIAMGADVVAMGTAAMMAVGCQQYRVCDKDKCPVGVATQDPALRARLDVAKSTTRVANFFKVNFEELKEFARLCGNDDIHKLSLSDLCTSNSEISNHIGIEHV